MEKIVKILLLVCSFTIVATYFSHAQENTVSVRFSEPTITYENGNRYVNFGIYLKNLGTFTDLDGYESEVYSLQTLDIDFNIDKTAFSDEPLDPLSYESFKDILSFESNWNTIYQNRQLGIFKWDVNYLVVNYKGKPAKANRIIFDIGNEIFLGTLRWKCLPTATSFKIQARDEAVVGNRNCSSAVNWDMNPVTIVFENGKNTIEGIIPDDPLQGVDKPKDLAGLNYICGPEKNAVYTVTRPSAVDSCAWFLSTDAAGKTAAPAGVAQLAVSPKGEAVAITWKKTDAKSSYYLQVYSIKGANSSDPINMLVTVEGFPEFTLPVETIKCKETELAWTPATGFKTFLYAPDYQGGAKNSSYTVKAADAGTYHFVRYRDGNAGICEDTVDFTPNILDPKISWQQEPVASIDRGMELTARWDFDTKSMPAEADTWVAVWTKPSSTIANDVKNHKFPATAENYDFEVRAEVNGCASNTLTGHTEVIGGGILPNPATLGGQNIACKDGGVMLTSVPSGGTPPYTWKWHEKGNSATEFSGQSVWVTPSATTKYYVDVTDAKGASGRDSIVITYNDVASMVVSAGDDQAIINGTYTYVCGSIVSAGASSSCTWNWAPADMLANGSEKNNRIARTKALTASQEYAVYVVDGNGCPSKPDTVKVKVFQDLAEGGGQPPLLPDDPAEVFNMTLSPGNASLCKNNSLQLAFKTSGINLEGAVYSWMPAIGLSDAAIPNPLLTVVDGVVSADYVLTIEKGDFKINRKVSVTVNTEEAPALQLATNRISCTGDVIEVTAAGTAPDQYVWLRDGVVVANTGNTYTLTDAGEHNMKVYAKNTGSACASDTIAVKATVAPAVTLTDVSPDVKACGATTPLSFASIDPAASTFKWVAPDNSVVSTSDKQITADQSGKYMLVAGEGVCSDTAYINVQLNNVLTAEGLKTLITGCEGTAELAFAATTASSFIWLAPDGTAIAGSKDKNPYTVSAEGYYGLALDGGDCKDTLYVAVKLNYMPVVTVKEIQTTCGNELAVNGTASAGTLYWSENSDGSNPFTDKATGSMETKTYYVYADAGAGCVSSKTKVEVSFGAKPTVIADALQTACESPYTLVASSTGSGDVKWYASATSVTPIDPKVEGNNNTSKEYWVCADDGVGCVGDKQKVTVRFGVSPQLTVKELQTTCENELELQASSTGGKLLWVDMEGRELLVTKVQRGNEDVQYYKVQAVDEKCSTGWEKVEVRFGAKPVVLAQTLQTVCGQEHTLVGSASDGELTWYKNSDGTGKLTSLKVTQVGGQAVSFYYAQAGEGTCKSDFQKIKVAFGTAPLVEVMSPQTTCEGVSLTLDAKTSGGSLVWKDADGTKLTSATVIKAGKYYVYAIDGEGVAACQAPEQEVDVRFGEKPTVIVSPIQTSCGNEYTLQAKASGGDLHWLANGVEIPAYIPHAEGEKNYTVYAQDGTCKSDEKTITVKFGMAPQLTFDSRQTTCETSLKLQASTTGGELIWKQGETELPTPLVTGVAGQSATYTVTAKDGVCVVGPRDVEAVFGVKPTITVEPLQTTCGTNYTLQATASAGAQLHWQADGASTETNADITGAIGTTSTYWVWAQKEGCSSDKKQVTVAFGAQPTVNASLISTCGTSAELVASVSGGSAVWTRNDGTVLDPVNGKYIVPGVEGKTDIYWVYARDGVCQSAKQQVNVSFGVPPVVMVDNNITACGEELTLSAVSSDKNATIHWLNDKSVEVTVANGSSGSIGTYYVYAKVSDACQSVPKPVYVHFGASPVLSALSPQTTCDTIVVLKAATSADKLIWEDGNGKTLTSSQVHGPAGTVATYYVTAVDGTCSSDRNAVEVRFGTKPEVIVKPEQTVCSANEYVLQAQATGGSLVWYKSDNTTILTDTKITKVGVGIPGIYYVEAKDGVCVSEERPKVTVYFDRAPEITVDKIQTTCGNIITLNASASAGDIVWTKTDGSVLPLPQATGATGETQQYYVYAKDGDCESPKETVDVKFGTAPTVVVEPIQTACGDSHILTATASDGNIHWLATADATEDLKSLTVTADGAASKTFYVYAENGKDCRSLPQPVTVMFGQNPLLTAVTPQTTCGQTIKLDASATGGELVWTDEFGSKLTTTQITRTTPGQETYYVTAVDGVCTSATRQVIAKFGSMPEVIAGDKQTTCGIEYTLEATASEGVLHYLASDKTELPSAVVNGDSETKTYYVYAQGVDVSCRSIDKEIKVTFGQKPTITVNQSQSTCEDVLQLEASATGGEIFWLQGAEQKPLLIPQVINKPGVETNYYVYAAASRDDVDCKSSTIPVTIAFGAKPTVVVKPLQTTCETSYALVATASDGATLHWLDGETDLGATPTVRGELNTTATYYVYAAKGMCSSDKVKVTVAFGVSPVVTAPELQTCCNATSLKLQASKTGGTLVWLKNGVTPPNPVSENPTINGIAGVPQTWHVYATDGSCKSEEIKVTVNFNVKPSVLVDELQTSCLGTYNLVALPTEGELHWLKADKTPLLSTAVDGLPNEVKEYYVYAQKGNDATCQGQEQKVTVVFGAAPQVTVEPIQTACGEAAAATATIQLKASATGGTLSWMDADGNALASTLQTANKNTTKTYRVKAVDATCPSLEHTVEARFGAVPVVQVEPLQTACTKQLQLKATTSAGNLVWMKGSTILSSPIVKSTDGNAFRVYAVDGSCQSDIQDIDVLYETIPVVSVVTPQTTCGNQLELQATATGGDVTWEDAGHVELKLTQVSGASNTEAIYYVYAKGDGCQSAKEMVQVRFGSQPQVLVMTEQTACEGEHVLTATATEGEIFWYASVDATTPMASTTVTGTKGESKDYYVAAKAGTGCESQRQKVTVHFGQPPVLTLSGLQTTCEKTLVLKASTSGGDLTWKNEAGGVLKTTEVKGEIGENAYYYVTATDGACSSTTERVEVRFGATPEVIADAVQTTCGIEYTLQATPTEGKLNWFAANGTTLLPSTTVSKPTDSSTAEYYVQAQNGTCIGKKQKISVAFGAQPMLTVVTPQTTCGEQITLSANTTGGKPVWTDGEGTKLISPVVKGVPGETSVFYVQAMNEDGSCQSLKEEVTVHFEQKPVINVNNLQTACGEELALKATATGGSVYWLKSDRKSVLPSNNVTGTRGSTATYYVYAAGDATCHSDTVAVTAKFGSAPVLSVVTPQTTCGNALNLMASATGGVIEWTHNGRKVLPPVAQKQGAETETFLVQAVDETCSSAKETVIVKFGTLPEVIAETLQTSCDTMLTLAGSVSAGSIVWMDSDHQELKSPAVHGKGIHTYYVKARAGAGCESEEIRVKVAFETAPEVNVLATQTSCGTSLKLQATASAGNLVWKDAANKTLTNTLINKENASPSYTVQAIDGKCQSTIETVEVKFSAPQLFVEPIQATCGTQYKLQAKATGGQIHWVNSSMDEIPSVVTMPAVDNSLDVWVYAKDGDECQTSPTKVTVKFGVAPQIPADILIQTTCSSPYKLRGTSVGGNLVWMQNGKELINTTVNLVDGDNIFYVYAEDYNCTPESKTATEKVIVTLSGRPELALNDVHCVGDTLRAEGQSGETGLAYRWFVNDAQNTAYTDNYYVFSAGGDYDVKVVAQNSGGCISDTARAAIRISTPMKLEWETKPATSVAYGTNLNGCVKLISGNTADIKAYNWISPAKAGISGRCFNIPAKEQEYLFQVYTNDANGCVSDTLKATTAVTGFGTLDLALESTSGTEICLGGSALLTAVVEGGQAPYTYEWYVKGGTTPVRTQTTASAVDMFGTAPAANVTYVVKVKDAQATPAVAQREIALTVKAGSTLPVADAGPDMTIQKNLQTLLKGGNAIGIKSWSWLPVDKLNKPQEAGLQYPMTAKLATSQKYQLYVTDNNGCVSLPDEVIAYVLPLDGTEDGELPTPPVDGGGGITPGLDVAIKPLTDTICLGTERWITVKDKIGNLTGAATFTWTPVSDLKFNTRRDSALFRPASAGDYVFVVMVEDGASRIGLRSNIHVKDAYAPDFNLAVTGNCQHDTVKMVYTDGSVAADKFNWKVKGTAVNCNESHYVLANTGNYTVEVSAENGGCLSVTKSVGVTVNAAPQITNFVLADSCGQAVVEVTASGATAGYTWTATPEGEVDAVNNTRYIVKGTGNFEITVEASNGTCIAQQTLKGLIHSRPALASWITEPVDVAKNASITAAVSAANGTPAYTYHWLQPDGASSVTTGSCIVNPAVLANYTFEVYASDAKGCVSDTLKKTVSVTGGDITIDIRSVYGNVVCKGGAAMLVAHARGIEAPCVFEWTKKGQTGYVRNTTAASVYDTLWIKDTEVGEYLVNVKKTSAGAILSQATIASLSVDAAKEAPQVTTEKDLTIQSGGHTALLADVTKGTPEYKWHWSPANRLANLADTAVQYPLTANLTEKQVYRVYVTDANSCVSVPAATTVSINANGLCVDINPQDKEICRGNTVTMVAEISCGKPSGYEPVYTWLPAAQNALLDRTDNDSVVFTPLQEGKYAWLVKVTNGGVIAVARTYVTVRDADAPKLALEGRSECINDTLTVKNSGEVADKYVWTVDGLEVAENGERLVLADNTIEHIEVYAEAANGCRSDLLSRDMKLGITPTIEIAGGSFVNYPDSVNVIKVKQGEDLTKENYTFAWTSVPIGKFNGATDLLSVKTMPINEDVKYTFVATSKDNSVCAASDTVWGYMIPKKANVEIAKDEITGNLQLTWKKEELGLADSVRVMNIKWDGYGVQSVYAPKAMLKGDMEKYIIDTSKDTLAFFYINASRYIQEMGKSYYSHTSDTVGYMRQWLYKNASVLSGSQFNYIAYPFDMTSGGIKTMKDLVPFIGFNSTNKYAITSIAQYVSGSWGVGSISTSGTYTGVNAELVTGNVYRIILRDNESLQLLFFGVLPSKYSYTLQSNGIENFIITPLSFGKTVNRALIGLQIENVNTVGSFKFSDQGWTVSTKQSNGNWVGTAGDYNIHLYRPIRVILKTTSSDIIWKY